MASSDNLEQHIVLWKGARRVTARELKERLVECRAALKRISLLSLRKTASMKTFRKCKNHSGKMAFVGVYKTSQ